MIYLTGATGLIGASLFPKLLENGHKVIALSRFAKKKINKKLININAFNFDLNFDDPFTLPHPDEPIALILLASHITSSRNIKDFDSVFNIDTIGHLHLLEFLHSKLRHIIYASSCTVYGWPKMLPVVETAPLNPENVYSLAKISTEKTLCQFKEKYNVPVTIFRISQIYGPGAPNRGAIYQFLELARNGKRPRIFCNPQTTRDYIHISDVVNIIIYSLNNLIHGIYNIGSGKGTTIGELANICIKIARSNKKPKIIKTEGAKMKNMVLDITKAKRELNFFPCVKLEYGLRSEYERLYKPNASIREEKQ